MVAILTLTAACSTSQTDTPSPPFNLPTSASTTTANTAKQSPTAASGTTVPVNLAVNFGTIDLTILNIQQAQHFDDDGITEGDSIIRVNFKEANNTDRNAAYSYDNVARLILTDGSSIAPGYTKNGRPPVGGSTQVNWLDFPVSAGTGTSGLILRLGNQQQAQMDIPLKEKADLSQYQPKIVQLNKSVTQGKATWKLTQATLRWSGAGKQAEKGMRYVILQLEVTASSNINYGLGENARLKAGDSTATADYDGTTIPSSLAGGTNAKGIATFQVPQGVTNYTFLLLGDESTPEAKIDFQI